MPLRWKSPCPELLLTVTVVSVCLTGCSKNEPATESAETRKLIIGKCTLAGKFRRFNEDAIAVEKLSGSVLCLAADGMGGEAGGKILGQVAAERAFKVVIEELAKELPQATTREETRTAIRRAIVAANKDIMAMGRKDPDFGIMGTTLVLALGLQEDGMYVAGLGDSRAYVIRGDKIEQLTVDHTVAQAMVEAKVISPEEARTHRFRNILWKYLGSPEVGEGPEIKYVPLKNGDRLLLCTDGLHGVVSDERILHCMHQFPEVQQCAESLCQMALDAGSRDDISSIVIEMVENR